MSNVFYEVGDDVVVKHDNLLGTPFKGKITQFLLTSFKGLFKYILLQNIMSK